MANTETIKQASAQVVEEAANAAVVAISEEGGRQNRNTEQEGATEVTYYRTESSL